MGRLRVRRVYTAAVAERREVADGTVEVTFERPEGFGFQTGQYLQVRVPKLHHRDRRGASRVFSIASSPLNEDTVAIAYRDTGSGFKRTLGGLGVGENVLLEGPHGFCTLPRDPDQQVVLVAGGIGIVPFLSMIRFVAATDGPCPHLTLLYANRTRRAAAYLDELKTLVRGHPRLCMHTQFGPIAPACLRNHVRDPQQRLWYIAGPPAMVDTTRGALHGFGVPPWRVLFEEFQGY